MTKVPNGVEALPKISIAWVGCTNVTDDRRQTVSEHEDEFTFAKNRETKFSLSHCSLLPPQLRHKMIIMADKQKFGVNEDYDDTDW